MANTKINSEQIETSAITTDKLAPGQVTSAKLGPNAVTAPNIGPGAVTFPKISATGTASSSTYLRGDGSWASAKPSYAREREVFWNPGTWTKPSTTSSVNVLVVGGGGSNGVQPGQGTGNSGAASSFGSFVTANGGVAGSHQSNSPQNHGLPGTSTYNSGTATVIGKSVHNLPGGAFPGYGQNSIDPAIPQINSNTPVAYGNLSGGGTPFEQIQFWAEGSFAAGIYTGPTLNYVKVKTNANLPIIAYGAAARRDDGTGTYGNPSYSGNAGGAGGWAEVQSIPVSGPVSVTIGAGGTAHPNGDSHHGMNGIVIVEY